MPPDGARKPKKLKWIPGRLSKGPLVDFSLRRPQDAAGVTQYRFPDFIDSIESVAGVLTEKQAECLIHFRIGIVK